jgi:hypothetical protein
LAIETTNSRPAATHICHACRVREAYSFLAPEAMFSYKAPRTAQSIDLAAIAANASRQFVEMDRERQREQEQHAQKARRDRKAGRGHAAADSAAEGDEAGENGGPIDATEAELFDRARQQIGRRRLGEQQAAGTGQGGGRLRARRWLANFEQQRAAAQQQEQQQGHGAGGDDADAEEVEEPAAGSYAAALLRAFEPGAAERAHAAARRLKLEVMGHNRDFAAQFLEEAAGMAAALDAAEAAEAAEAAAAEHEEHEQGGED